MPLGSAGRQPILVRLFAFPQALGGGRNHRNQSQCPAESTSLQKHFSTSSDPGQGMSTLQNCNLSTASKCQRVQPCL